MTLVLEGRVTLNCEYDAENDILYAWIGDKPRQAITYETDEGHLVRLDPETQGFVGVTIFEWSHRSTEEIRLEWEVEVEVKQPSRPWRPRKKKAAHHAREHAVLHRFQTA
jgi:uncharacterized protein YuzE